MTRLSWDVQREMVTLLGLGVPVATACSAVGIGESTFRAWRAGKSPQHKAFRVETDKARALGEVTLVKRIQQQSARSWRAAVWLLENEYGWARAGSGLATGSEQESADPLAEIIDLAARR